MLVGIVTVGAARHRVDEPLGAAHVRRRAGRFRRRSRSRPWPRPTPTTRFAAPHYLDELAEGQAETFECRRAGARRARVLGRRQRRRHRPRGGRPPAHLRAARHRAAAPGRGAHRRRRRRRCAASSRRRRWRSRCSTPQRCACVQVNQVAARVRRPHAPSAARHARREELFGADVAAERAARPGAARSRSSEVTTREYRIERDGAACVWDARSLPLAPRAGDAPDQLLLVATDVTEQRAAAGGAARGGDRAARDAGAGSPPPHQEQPAGRRRAAAADRAAQARGRARRSPRPSARCRRSPRSTACRSARTGPLRVVERGRGDRRLGAAHTSAGRSDGRVEGRARRPLGAAGGEAIPIALTLNELLDQRDQAQPRRRSTPMRCDAATATTTACACPSPTRRRLPAGFDLARHPGRRVRASASCARCCRGAARTLTLEQHGDDVVAAVALAPPGVQALRWTPEAASAAAPRVHRRPASRTACRLRRRFARRSASRRECEPPLSSDARARSSSSTTTASCSRPSRTAWRRPATTSSTPTTATTRSCSRAQHQPDLALLDIRMEGKSGFDVAAVPARLLPDAVHVPLGLLRRCHGRAGQGARRGGLPGEAARHRSRSCPPSRRPSRAWATRARPRPRSTDPLADLVPVAVGVLMHRHSLPRAQALERLRRQAGVEGRTLQAQAQRVVEAVEVLSDSGQSPNGGA